MQNFGDEDELLSLSFNMAVRLMWPHSPGSSDSVN